MTRQKSKIFLLGGDLSSSKSYIMQNTIYRHFGLPFEYCMCSFESQSELCKFIAQHSRDDFFAANVTFPFKHDVLNLAQIEDFDECCQFSCGTNLLLSNGHDMSACNYDGPGLGMYLEKNDIEVKGISAMIFGTGITARSIAFALIQLGVKQIIFVSRTEKKASELFDQYRTKFEKFGVECEATTYNKIETDLQSVSLVINATPMGKFADIIDANPMNGYEFNQSQTAIDVVYTHGLTPFLTQAKNSGCHIYDGTYMLAAQAALSVLKIVEYFGP